MNERVMGTAASILDDVSSNLPSENCDPSRPLSGGSSYISIRGSDDEDEDEHGRHKLKKTKGLIKVLRTVAEESSHEVETIVRQLTKLTEDLAKERSKNDIQQKENSKVLSELKHLKTRQQEETNAVKEELQILEKEIEDVTQIKLSTRNENDSNSQRIKDIILTIKGKKKAKRLEQAHQEVEGAKQACNHYSDLLHGTYSAMLEIFDCTESPSQVKPITDDKVPTWMQGLIIVVTKIDDCVQHNLERQFVESGPILQILGKMHYDVMHEQYKKAIGVHVVGQKSQRRKDNVQGKPTNDQTSVITEICEKVTERYNQVVTGLEKEIAELKMRLAKLAGEILTNNNPNIADLNDPNRPTKLAEKYSELFDDAWTDAYEELEKSRKSEKENIQLLFDILSQSYRECADISKQQQQTIVKALTEQTDLDENSRGKDSVDVKLSPMQSEAVTELRKQSADIFIKSLQYYFGEKYKKDTYRQRWFEKGPLQNYTMKCIELCWLMQVQAPPVYIELKSGEKFDTNKFKPYTKSGNNIDFVVWPPLLLNEGGSLLCKGVAQGK